MYFNTKEAAEFLKCKPVTIRRAVESGELIGAKVGKGYIFTENQLNAFVEQKLTRKIKRVN